MSTPSVTRRPVLRSALLVAVASGVWFGGVLLAARAGVLDRNPAVLVGVVGVGLLLWAHLWASRNRWILSFALLLVPGVILFASPTMTGADRAGVGFGSVAAGSLLLLATVATAAWAGNRWGPSGPMGKVTDLF